MAEPEVNFDKKFEEFMQKLVQEQEKQEKANKKLNRAQRIVTGIVRVYMIYSMILGGFVLLALLARLLYPVFDLVIHAFSSLFT